MTSEVSPFWSVSIGFELYSEIPVISSDSISILDISFVLSIFIELLVHSRVPIFSVLLVTLQFIDNSNSSSSLKPSKFLNNLALFLMIITLIGIVFGIIPWIKYKNILKVIPLFGVGLKLFAFKKV